MKNLLLLLAIFSLGACQTLSAKEETSKEYNQRMTEREVQDLKAVFRTDY